MRGGASFRMKSRFFVLWSIEMVLILILLGSSGWAYGDGFTVKESPTTARIKKIEKTWPIKGLRLLQEQSESFKLQAIQSEADPLIIGAAQFQTIDASLERVTQVLDQFEDYPRIFDGLKKAEVRERKVLASGDLMRLFFEQSVPVPFVPNDVSEMIYEVNKKIKGRTTYRYQLHEGNHLVSSDGLVVLESISPTKTQYFEIDFFNAEWGFAKAMGAKKIWENSLKGLLQSDLAFKLKAEDPKKPLEEVLSESKKLARDYPIEKRYLDRIQEKEWFNLYE